MVSEELSLEKIEKRIWQLVLLAVVVILYLVPDRKPGISRPRSLDWTRFSVVHWSQIQKNLNEIGCAYIEY